MPTLVKKPGLRKKAMPALAAIQEIETVVEEPVESLLAIQDEINAHCVVGRSVAVKALLLAVLTKQHLMLDGPPGIAKTMLAREFISRIDEDGTFKSFQTQLSKGSVSEQLLGPMNIRRLREDSVCEYNYEGMLPSAHMAIIDEVYRGPDMLLPCLFSILNERILFNGATQVSCPLVTAVGTTNFSSDAPELAAFHDRWLINCRIERLSSENERHIMLLQSLNPKQGKKTTISLSAILQAQEEVRKVKIAPIYLKLYDRMVEEIVVRHRTSLRFEISDRRRVQALRLAQASAYLSKRKEINTDDLAATEFGLIFKGVPNEETAFMQGFTSVIGQYQQLIEEETNLTKVEAVRNRYFAHYSAKMTKEKLSNLQSKLRQAISQSDSFKFTDETNERKFQGFRNELDELLRTVAEDLAPPDEDEQP